MNEETPPIIICRICDAHGPAAFLAQNIATGAKRGLCGRCVAEILYQLHRASEHPDSDCDAAPGQDDERPFSRVDAQDTAEAIRRFLS